MSQQLLYKLLASRQLSSVLFPLRNLTRKLAYRAESLDSIVGQEPLQSPPLLAEHHQDFGVVEYPLVPDPYEQREAFGQTLDFDPTTMFVSAELHSPVLDPLNLPHPITAAEEISAAIDQVRGIDAMMPEPLAPPDLEQIVDNPFADPLFPPLFDRPM